MPYTAKDVNKILEKKVQTKRKAYTADDVNAILRSGKTGAQVIEEHNNARKAQRKAVTNANAAQSSSSILILIRANVRLFRKFRS